jgi:hypothetical protein
MAEPTPNPSAPRRNRWTQSGEGPIIRAPKPVKSIGRDTARLYCESCGAKRKACRCHEADRDALAMAQIESRFRIS